MLGLRGRRRDAGERSVPYGFSIVGVQKSGTTTLAAALDRHPAIAKSPVKEVHFFDDEERDWSDPAVTAEYRVASADPAHVMAGDATPSYLYWPHALERLAAHNPDHRLVALFRDPLERLFSHWTMQRHRYDRWPDWPTFLRKALTELPADIPDDLNAKQFYRRSGVIRGMYGAQLRRGFEVFDRSQWLLVEFRAMLADFDSTLDRATDHLGLERFAERPELHHGFRGADSVVGTAPSAEDLSRLAEAYAADLADFTALSGLDTSAWPTRRIAEGTLDPADLAATFATRVRPA